jgi:hypothetical protein
MNKSHFLIFLIGFFCILSSCKTGFDSTSKKYRKGFYYGEKRMFDQAKQDSEITLSDSPSINSQEAIIPRNYRVENENITSTIQGGLINYQSYTTQDGHLKYTDAINVTYSNEEIQEPAEQKIDKKEKSKDEELAEKKLNRALRMYLYISILYTISILSIFIPGALYLMLSALALMLPFIILMMIHSIKAYCLSDNKLIRRKSITVFISGILIILIGIASIGGLYLLGLTLGNFPLN